MADKQILNTKIIFFGTPEFAVATLEAVYKAGYPISAVVTTPDKPAGRGHKIQTSAVKEFAVRHNLLLLQPPNLKDATFIDELQRLNADVFIVVAFRKLPAEVWSIPPLGTFNLHASLLPNYRGAAPINWAVIKGEKETGVTTFLIDDQIDTGYILMSRSAPIYETDDAGDVHDRLMALGAGLVLKTIDGLTTKTLSPKPQSAKESEKLPAAPRIFQDICQINWHSKAHEIINHIRGLSPYPSARTTLFGNSEPIPIKIFKAQQSAELLNLKPGQINKSSNSLIIGTLSNAIELKEIQPATRKRMKIADFLNGLKSELSHAQ